MKGFSCSQRLVTSIRTYLQIIFPSIYAENCAREAKKYPESLDEVLLESRCEQKRTFRCWLKLAS